MKLALTILSFMIALTNCTTASAPEPTREELIQWIKEQEAFEKEMSSEQQELRAEARSEKMQPAVWRVEKNGKTSWLLGTFHAGISSGSLPLTLDQRMRSSRVVVMENDLGTSDDQRRDLALLRDARQERDDIHDRLSEQLSEQAWQKFTHDLLPFSPEQLDRVSPGTALDLYKQYRILYFFRSSSLDVEIQSDLKVQKRPLVYLETDSEVYRNLAKGSPDEQVTVAELQDFLLNKSKQEIKTEVAKVYKAMQLYKRGDIASLEKEISAKIDYERVIADRNHKWLPTLQREIDRGDAFIAVGTAHMTGSASLAKLLSAKGYTVKRL